MALLRTKKKRLTPNKFWNVISYRDNLFFSSFSENGYYIFEYLKRHRPKIVIINEPNPVVASFLLALKERAEDFFDKISLFKMLYKDSSKIMLTRAEGLLHSSDTVDIAAGFYIINQITSPTTGKVFKNYFEQFIKSEPKQALEPYQELLSKVIVTTTSTESFLNGITINDKNEFMLIVTDYNESEQHLIDLHTKNRSIPERFYSRRVLTIASEGETSSLPSLSESELDKLGLSKYTHSAAKSTILLN